MTVQERDDNLILYRIDQLEKVLHEYLREAKQERRDMQVRITRLEERQKFLEKALVAAGIVAAGAGAGHIPSFL